MDDHSGRPEAMGPAMSWGERREYAVPTYTAPEGVAWYHFLHGNVPGHQIDFMYRPEVPQGPLGRVHFNHLATLMKYIEPARHGEFAFAVGNLSRDDTQHEPGHGGLAIIFGFRLRGATDHAGRRDPPFAHGIAAVGRSMDYGALRASSLGLYERLFGQGSEGPSIALYREYVRCVRESPGFIEDALRAYTAGFATLPRPLPSSMSLRWVTNEAPQPKRIVIVHPDGAPFAKLAEAAAKVAAVLYRSDVRWTAITSGRESDAPKGVMIRLVAQRDAAAFEQGGGPVMRIEEVPDDEATLARELFGAQAVAVEAPERSGSWRKQLQQAPSRLGGMTQVMPVPAAAAGALQGMHGPATPSYGNAAPHAEDQAGNMAAHARGRAAPERVAFARMDEEPTLPMMPLSTGSEGGAGAIEPPRDFERSARFSPGEVRAAIGAPEGSALRPREAPTAPSSSPGARPISRPPPPLPGQVTPVSPQKAALPMAEAGAEDGVRLPEMRRAQAPDGPNAREVPGNAVAPEVFFTKLGPVSPAEQDHAKVAPGAIEMPDLAGDFSPPPKSRTAVWLALFAGAAAVTGLIYFMVFSPPPAPFSEPNPPSSAAPSPTTTATAEGGAQSSRKETIAPSPPATPGPTHQATSRPPQPRNLSPKAVEGQPPPGKPKPGKPQPAPRPATSRGDLWRDPELK